MTSLAIKAITVLAMIGTASHAATITISDLLDANPVVTISADLTNTTAVLTFEQAVISGFLPAGLQVAPGTRSVILTEPASDPFGSRQSDFVTLVIGAAAPTFTLTFESDGALNFDRDVAALPPTTPTILENGNFQDLSTLLNSGAFSISVQSDLQSPEIPEPTSATLLVTGLVLGCIGLIRRKRVLAFGGRSL